MKRGSLSDPDHPIIDSPWEYRVTELRYVIEAPEGEESYIDIVLVRNSSTHRLRFWSPRDFHVQEGFCPNMYLGLQILDVSRRQLENISIEVSCFENTPGFGFYARTIEEIPAGRVN